MSVGYVKVRTFDAGMSFQQIRAKKQLVLDKFYPISHIEIGSWCTDVTLEKDGTHNSVFFYFYDENKNFLEKGIFAEELDCITEHDY